MVEFGGRRSPEVGDFNYSPTEEQLPDGICAIEIGLAVDGVSINEAQNVLRRVGLETEAASLDNFDDVYRECGTSGCQGWVRLSNQAGTVMVVDHGRSEDSCIKID